MDDAGLVIKAHHLILVTVALDTYLIHILTEGTIATETQRAGTTLPESISSSMAFHTGKAGVRETAIYEINGDMMI